MSARFLPLVGFASFLATGSIVSRIPLVGIPLVAIAIISFVVTFVVFTIRGERRANAEAAARYSSLLGLAPAGDARTRRDPR